MNASAGSMSGSFERDCVVISAVQPINIPKASENSSGTALVGRAESMDVAKSAPASCPISRPPRPPMSHGAPKLAAAQTMTQASQQTSNMTYTSPANQAADAESAASSQPQQLSRAACLRLSAHLLLELAASKSKDGANKEGLVLSVLALQGLSVTVSLCADRGGPEADLSSVEIMKLMGSVLADTQEVAQSLNLSDCELTYVLNTLLAFVAKSDSMTCDCRPCSIHSPYYRAAMPIRNGLQTCAGLWSCGCSQRADGELHSMHL